MKHIENELRHARTAHERDGLLSSAQRKRTLNQACSSGPRQGACRNRDRGPPRGGTPPTPPDIRVRIRRFGWLHAGHQM
jgi:hypothetical protein